MLASARRTRDHEQIRQWVEDRGGSPATVIGTENDSGAGLLRVDFPGYSGEGRLKKIAWEEFFEKFDEADLDFLYQDKTADGKLSRFFKFVSSNDDDRRSHHSHPRA
jgi:hypothetical protein